VELVIGAGKLDRTLENVEVLVDAYRIDDGLRYLDYRPLTPPDRIVPEDLAVTILINSRVAGTAFRAVQDRGHEVALDGLPAYALEDADERQRQAVCDVISTVVAWPGFAATKVLHKKRPALIPVLDNEAIFGAYMSPSWPEQRASMDSVYSPGSDPRSARLDLVRPHASRPVDSRGPYQDGVTEHRASDRRDQCAIVGRGGDDRVAGTDAETVAAVRGVT
jgi:Family of unknown function (DUF6308)